MSTREEPPAGWTKTTVGAVGRVQLGRQRSPKNHSGPHMRPYLRVANVFEDRINLDDVMEMNFTPAEYEVFKLEPGDILLNEGQSLELVGRPAMYRGELPGACFTNSLVRFQAGPLLDPKFALYVFLGYLHTGRFQRIATNTVNIAHLGAGRFADMEFWLPPRSEQERIVAKADELLSDLDAGVASLKRARANLKRYRASVLKAAVEGRLTEEWRKKNPQAEDGQMLLDRILRERREKWERDLIAGFAAKGKNSPKNWQSKYAEPPAPNTKGLPTLPFPWASASVAQLGKVQLGRQRSPQHHTGTHMRPYLRVANVFEDRIDLTDVMAMNFTPDEFAIYELHDGDILLNEGQSMELVGRPAMYRGELPGACFTNSLIRFQPGTGVNHTFALIVFLAYLKTRRFQHIASITVNLAHLSAGRFAEMTFPVPPREEQREIVQIVEKRLSAIDVVEKRVDAELIRSKNLRRLILRQALSGTLKNT